MTDMFRCAHVQDTVKAENAESSALARAQEWAEAGYWKQKPGQAAGIGEAWSGVQGRVPPSAFWADYAAHLAHEAGRGGEAARAPFLSRHLERAGRTFTDAAAALAVIGAPPPGCACWLVVTGGALRSQTQPHRA